MSGRYIVLFPDFVDKCLREVFRAAKVINQKSCQLAPWIIPLVVLMKPKR